MTRRCRITGRFKSGRADLLCARVESAPHVRGNATRKAAWLVLRDGMTARLRAGQ